MQCEYYALEGLSDLLNTVSQLQSSVNEQLEIFGVLRTLVDTRSKLAMEVSRQVARHFGKKAFKTSIPRNIRIAEAPSYGLPVIIYDKRSPGAQAYMKVAKEFVKRCEPKSALKKKSSKKKVSRKKTSVKKSATKKAKVTAKKSVNKKDATVKTKAKKAATKSKVTLKKKSQKKTAKKSTLKKASTKKKIVAKKAKKSKKEALID